MNWIKDLSVDFTQDFLFTYKGVEDPNAWIAHHMGLKSKDWSQKVTLSRDEILTADSGSFCLALRQKDLGKAPIQCVITRGGMLSNLEASLVLELNDEIVQVSFYEKPFQNIHGIEAFSEIQSLSISSCENLEDLTGLGALLRLCHLRLAFCPSLTDLSEIEGLTQMSKLNLEGCEGLVRLPSLNKLRDLRELKLASCSELTSLDEASQLSTLETIDLSWCENLNSLRGLEGCAKLRKANLSGCSSLIDASQLAELCSLESVDLSQCESLESVSWGSNQASLMTVDMSSCVALRDVSSLSNLIGLRELDLGGCDCLTSIAGLTDMKELASLSLDYCPALNDLSALASLTGLRVLSLTECEKLEHLGMLSRLTALQSIDLRDCKSLQDVNGLKELKCLTSLDIRDSPFVDHESTREILNSLGTLKKLSGIAEPWRTQILWNAAVRREDQTSLNDMLEQMLEVCTSRMSSLSLRADFIESLTIAAFSDEQLKRIHDIAWSREEWSRLLLLTDNRLDPVGAGPKYGFHEDGSIVFDTVHTFFRDTGERKMDLLSSPVGIRDAMKGYILAVAEGARWEGSHEVIAMAADQAVLELDESNGCEPHPSWDESIVDLLMAIRTMGLEELHDDLLRAVSDASRQTLDQRLRVAAAEVELEKGRWAMALQHMKELPAGVERDLMSRIIPMVVGDKVPDAVLNWLDSVDTDYLEVLIEDSSMTRAEGLQNSGIREALFWLHTGSRSGFLELVGTFFEHFPDDPWVLALHAECMGSVSEGGKESSRAGRLTESLQSETISTLLGPMVSQQLATTLQGKTEKDLHQLAVALLLEHFGTVTPQFRDTILKAL